MRDHGGSQDSSDASAPSVGPKTGRDRVGQIVAVGAIGLTFLGILSLMSPELLMSPTLVTRGDLGAHVYPLHEFVYRLLPSGALSGWAHGWLGGLPLYTFYFPLPALLVAVGTPLLGFEVAIKWMVALGPLTLPFASFALLRSIGLSRWTATGGSVMGSSYILMLSYNVLGGNLLSTFLGEFAYAISFSLSLSYLAVVASSGRRGVDGTVPAAGLLALTALSHVLTTAAVVASTVPLLWMRSYRRTVVGSWLLGFLLAGFWAFPFLARLGYTSGPAWTYQPSLPEILPGEVAFFLPLALVGGFLLARRHRKAAVPLLCLPILAVAFNLVPQTVIHGGRWLPYGFFAVHALAGVAVGAALQRFASTRSRWSLAAASAGVVLCVGFNVVRTPTLVRDYVRQSLAGYEASDGWDEYQDLVARVSALPPGRVLWEESEHLERYGSPLALHLLPYWTPDHPVLKGLWRESSLSYPFGIRVSEELSPMQEAEDAEHGRSAPFNFERGVEHARIMGVRYFIAFSDTTRVLARARSDMLLAIEAPPWSVFELAGVSLVDVVDRQPAVYEGADFGERAMLWFDSLYAARGILAADGPPAWPRVDASFVAMTELEGLPSGEAVVSDIEMGDQSVSFRTSAVGIPHLVRISFFPNWLAIGADGPYRASPAFMVVVPREEEVRLEYVDSNVEWGGRALTLLGLVVTLVLVARPAKRRPANQFR